MVSSHYELTQENVCKAEQMFIRLVCIICMVQISAFAWAHWYALHLGADKGKTHNACLFDIDQCIKHQLDILVNWLEREGRKKEREVGSEEEQNGDHIPGQIAIRNRPTTRLPACKGMEGVVKINYVGWLHIAMLHKPGRWAQACNHPKEWDSGWSESQITASQTAP